MCCCSQTQSGEKYSDPFKLGWRDLKGLYEDIRKVSFIFLKPGYILELEANTQCSHFMVAHT